MHDQKYMTLCTFNSYYLCFCSVTVILLHCGSFCHENKFLLCVNIPGNKAQSDFDHVNLIPCIPIGGHCITSPNVHYMNQSIIQPTAYKTYKPPKFKGRGGMSKVFVKPTFSLS